MRHGAKLPHYLRSVSIIDTHTHLYQPAFDGDRVEAMARCEAVGVNTLLLPNIDTASIARVHDMMDRWPDRCFGMMGLHPCHVQQDAWEGELGTIETALRSSDRRYVAIGEIGFDLHWDKTTLDIQHLAFQVPCNIFTTNIFLIIHVTCKQHYNYITLIRKKIPVTYSTFIPVYNQ